VVALARAHGRTGLSGAAGDDEAARYFLSDRPEEFVKVPFNDLGAMERALAAGDVAAVVIETIPATSGFPLPETGYLPGVKALCDRQGTFYIADEVQTGLGRTGSLWGVETHGVQPDILVAGKGLSGGLYPISVVVLSPARGRLAHGQRLGPRLHVRRLELGCVVPEGSRNHHAPRDCGHRARVADVMGKELRGIRSRHPFLAEIRHAASSSAPVRPSLGGMLMARALYEAGVVAMPAGFDRSVIQWKPGCCWTRRPAATSWAGSSRSSRRWSRAEGLAPGQD
jgi:acetylornithine/succinyldiaminopimelate/putrescine aminotransferase